MTERSSALLTDLYQINMMQAYLDRGATDTAVFELFVRNLPPRRRFLVAAGLEQALQFLETLQISPAEIEWLKSTGRFRPNLIDYLSSLRFSGDVHAMPEGSVFFANEPIMRVTAPLPLAQFVESRLINIVHYQTLIAAKAARMMLAAPNKVLVDFGFRRAHGAEAGLMAARASYLTGFAGTATVLAGQEFGIPIYGTMAHSFIESFDDESAAFAAFAQSRPDNLVLLIDTYDVEAAARKVVALAPKLQQAGITIRGVRLDSGDLIALSRSIQDSTREGMDELGDDLVVMQKGASDIFGGFIPEPTIERVAAVPGVARPSGEMATFAMSGFNPVLTLGWPDGSYLWQKVPLREGRAPAAGEHHVVVLGDTAAATNGSRRVTS